MHLPRVCAWTWSFNFHLCLSTSFISSLSGLGFVTTSSTICLVPYVPCAFASLYSARLRAFTSVFFLGFLLVAFKPTAKYLWARPFLTKRKVSKVDFIEFNLLEMNGWLISWSKTSFLILIAACLFSAATVFVWRQRLLKWALKITQAPSWQLS